MAIERGDSGEQHSVEAAERADTSNVHEAPRIGSSISNDEVDELFVVFDVEAVDGLEPIVEPEEDDILDALSGDLPDDQDAAVVTEVHLEELDPDAPESVLETKDATGIFRTVTPEDLPRAPDPEEIMVAAAATEDFLRATEEIARLSSSIEEMRAVMLTQSKQTGASASAPTETVERFSAILAEFQALREEVASAQRSAERSIDLAESARERFQEVHDRLDTALSSSAPVALRPRGREPKELPLFDTPFVLLAVGVILMSWAITVYVRTGDGRSTLIAIVLANLAASSMLIHARTGRLF